MSPSRYRQWMGLVAALAFLAPASGARGAPIEDGAATHELTLSDCLSQTLLQSPEIQRLRQDLERAAGDRVVYRSRALPQLAGSIDAGLRTGPLYSPAGPYAALQAAFTQPLIDVGVPPSWHRGTMEVIIAEQSLGKEINSRLHEARVTFLSALYFRDLIGLYRQIGARLQANADGARQRLDAGTGGQAALMEAQIQVLNLGRDLTALSNSYFTAITHLAELTGRDPAPGADGGAQLDLPRPVGTLSYVATQPDWRQATAEALRDRADLKLLQALVDATASEKRITQAGYFPLVSLTASELFLPSDILLSKRSTTVVTDQGTISSEHRAGVQMSWAIIDNGQVTGAARSLEAVRQEYQIDLCKLEQAVPRELARIRGDLEHQDAQLAALQKSAEEAEENLKLIESKVALGQATQLDFLDAQRGLLSVRAGIVSAVYLHEVARAEIDLATGRYLEFTAAGAP